MDTKIGSPTFHTWGLKSIQQPYNIHTYLSVTASNKYGSWFKTQLLQLFLCRVILYTMSIMPYTFGDWNDV